MSNHFVGRIILAAGLLALYTGESRADIDCDSIAACVISYTPDLYNPAFQVTGTGPFSLQADLFLDGNCSDVYFNGSAEGTIYGRTTFIYGLETEMNPGDLSSWKVRVAGCPETSCLTAVAGVDVCIEH